MVQVIWTPQSLRNLRSIRAYIAQANVAAADRIAQRLEAAGNGLIDFPDRGRPAERGMREIATVPPYILRYRVVGDKVYIVRIKHGRQHR